MTNLIRSDLYRMKKSKVFILFGVIVFAVSALWPFVEYGVMNIASMFAPDASMSMDTSFDLASILANPMGGFLIIFMLLSFLSFAFGDIAHGYIKNIAGLFKRRSSTVVSKFVVMMIHNLIFAVISVLGAFGGYALRAVMFGGTINFSENLTGGISVFLLKFLIGLALASIILFFATAIRAKTVGAVLSVIFGLGTLSLLYTLAENFIKFDLGKIMPDALYSSISLTTLDTLAVNAVVSSVVVIALFTIASIIFTNKRDVK